MTDVLDAVAAGGVVPEAGQLVSVRDRRWVVTDVERSTQPVDVLGAGAQRREHLITLTSVEDDAFGDELRVIWELERATRILDRAALPVPEPLALPPADAEPVAAHADERPRTRRGRAKVPSWDEIVFGAKPE